ncbi:MAG TPA: deiodinase-like protein [Terriglobales bacterium]|nr:deiodinase-like protein [Terriglobales bacterium]
MFGLKSYNYKRFTNDVLLADAAKTGFGTGPEPGERAPDFKGRILDGDTVRLSDYEGKSNVVLTFGSATCPFTAASIAGMNDLFEDYLDRDDVVFLFVYVREAHPGEKLREHRSIKQKIRAAELFREEEDVSIPIVVDDLDGKIHKKYGKLPNPTYLIDKSGHVAFRALWTRAKTIEKALEELLRVQHEQDTGQAIVLDGEDNSVSMTHAMLYSHRALERGGKKAVRDFREELGRGGRLAESASRIAAPIALNPGKTLVGAALAGAVIAGGLYGGMKLREARLRRPRNPYRFYDKQRPRESDDYAVGI